MSNGSSTKKGFISEADIAVLLRRYNANTVLALLQEIAKISSTQLNWNALVKGSNTGIKGAGEYQALWRHLAYRTNIADSFEDDSQPAEDDSDLEFEVEPLPGVSAEVAMQVAACVKVLDSAGTSDDPSLKTIAPEIPYAIDIPNSVSGWDVKKNGQVSGIIPSALNSNNTQISIPVSVGEQPAKKKRKFWTAEEDQELIAAVEKCGEGNWATILKGDFKHDRTASQLSQRWALIRKRREGQAGATQLNQRATQGSTAVGNQAVNASNSQLEEVHTPVPPIAAAAVPVDAPLGCNPFISATVSSTLAVQPPNHEQTSTRTILPTKAGTLPPSGKGRPLTKRSAPCLQPTGGRQIIKSAVAATSTVSAATTKTGSELLPPKAVPITAPPPSLLSPTTASGRFGSLRNSPGSSLGRGNVKILPGPDPMVQAAAVAAGARIAPASAAASLLKAAQSGNVVHIGAGGLPVGKSGLSNQGGNNPVTNTMRVGTSVTGLRNSGGAVVHYIHTGTGASKPFLLNGIRSPQPQSKQNVSRTLQADSVIRASPMAAPTQVTVSQAPPSPGPLLPSSQIRSGLSSTVQILKSKPKLLTGVSAGDQFTNNVSDDPGVITILESTPSAEATLFAMLPASLSNVSHHASSEQGADSALASLVPLESSQNICEATPEILSLDAITDTRASLVSTVANLCDPVNTGSLPSDDCERSNTSVPSNSLET